MSEESRAERFLAAFNGVDNYLRDLADAGADLPFGTLVSRASEMSSLVRTKSRTLRSYARLRNAIVHNHDRRAHPIAEPHERIVVSLERLLQDLLKPPMARDHWVPFKSMHTAQWHDSAIDVMRIMAKKSYSHVPILEGKTVVGVFNEWTPLEKAQERDELLIHGEETLAEFREWTLLERASVRSAVRFAARNVLLSDVLDIFREAFVQRVRVGVFYFTETGDPGQGVLGMVTPWDVVHVR